MEEICIQSKMFCAMKSMCCANSCMLSINFNLDRPSNEERLRGENGKCFIFLQLLKHSLNAT